MAKVFGSFSRLVSLLFRKDGQDITIRPNQATTYTGARDVQLPPGDTAHVVVSEGATQTLTNKTLDADLNTITNIENADIKSGAAIDAAKIANGSVSNTEFQYLDGVTSAIQTQLNTNATAISDHLSDTVDAHDASAISSIPSGNLAATDVQAALNELQTDVDTRATSSALTTHTGASSGVHGVTGSVVGTTDTQTLTNKLISSTAAVTGALTLPVGTQAERPTATEGMIRFNTDVDEFEGYANGAWASVGGGVNELPLKNYLKTYALAAVAPGTLSTLASPTANLVSLTAFYADSTSGSSALTQSSSTALRGSTNYLSALSGADTAGGRFFQFPAFALESTDLGKPVSISFDVTGNTTDNDWDVVVVRYNSSGVHQELISVAGNASTMTATPSAKLPTGTAQFQGFFVAGSTAGDLYAVRFRRRANAVQVRLDTLYVGPQPQLSSAAVTDWQSYTPTANNLGTGGATSLVGWWRRVGDSAQIYIAFQKDGSNGSGSSSVTFTIPSGLTLDTTKYQQAGVSAHVGTATQYAVEAVGQYSTSGVGTASTNALAVYNIGGMDYYYGSDYRAGSQTAINAIVPIANWSSNVTSAQRAVEEYVSFDGSQVVGAVGSLVPNVAFGSGQTVYDVTFQQTRQATDAVDVEIDVPGNGSWAKAPQLVPYLRGNNSDTTNFYGIQGFWLNSTTYRVAFGNRGDVISASNVSNGNNAWATLRGSNVRWRVRKVSGGAAVGYPVGARNVVGDVTGTAVPAGFIGENSLNQQTAGTSLTTGGVGVVSTPTLQPGTFLLIATINVTGAAAGDNIAAYWSGLAANNADVARGDAGNTSGRLVLAVRPRVVNHSVATAYTINVENATANRGTAFGSIVAVRVG